MAVKETVVTAKSYAAAVHIKRPSEFVINVAKIVIGILALAVLVVDGWLLDWYVVALISSILGWVLYAVGWMLSNGILILIVAAIWGPFLAGAFGSGIPGFVVQCIALLVIIVVTLPIGDFRLGAFFKNNRRHSLLVVFPLGLFTWIMLCVFGMSRIFIPPSNIPTSNTPTALLMAVLGIAALLSLHIVIFRRTERANIFKGPYSLNTRVLLGTQRASMPRYLSRYIFRVSMLSVTIFAILGIGIMGLIIMTISTSVSLVIRIFSSGDFTENNKLFFVAAVLPIPIAVLWVLFVVAVTIASLSGLSP